MGQVDSIPLLTEQGLSCRASVWFLSVSPVKPSPRPGANAVAPNDVGLTACAAHPCKRAAISSAFVTITSACLIEAMSMSRPSSDTAPLPSFCAWSMASRMRLA